jgi:hypothetical protein
MSDVTPEQAEAEIQASTRRAPSAGNTEKTLAASNAQIQFTPPAPPTGPAPIEYTAPPSYQAPAAAVIYDPTTPLAVTEYVTRSEFEALLERVNSFNNRSSQKI